MQGKHKRGLGGVAGEVLKDLARAPRRRVLIMGAGGRDFHNFNVCFRHDEAFEVVAFTAAQIPGIADRVYPPALSGPLYPRGIAIHDESELLTLIDSLNVAEVVFAYSDVSYQHVMSTAARVQAAGVDFTLLGPRHTMLPARVPVVAVVAVRTGAGKSQTSRKVSRLLKEMGQRVVVVRHPMAYGDLEAATMQRFANRADLLRWPLTVEEREEYEPHLAEGSIVYAGVDYERILLQAEEEADVIVWDGGNNDFSFFRPDLNIVVVDPLRAGHETSYYPGEINLRMADVVVVNKVDTASTQQVRQVTESIASANPRAIVVAAASPITVDLPELIRGRRVLVIEDGPTLTHGEMAFGAGVLAARQAGAAELIDPRQFAVGSLAAIYRRYGHIGPLLPAMGYSGEQLRELEETIARAKPETIVVATPIDLSRLLPVGIPIVHVTYALEERSKPDLRQILQEKLASRLGGARRESHGTRLRAAS